LLQKEKENLDKIEYWKKLKMKVACELKEEEENYRNVRLIKYDLFDEKRYKDLTSLMSKVSCLSGQNVQFDFSYTARPDDTEYYGHHFGITIGTERLAVLGFLDVIEELSRMRLRLETRSKGEIKCHS
jgi:hypothetical protein